MSDLRKALHAAAPQPERLPDPQVIWRNGLKRRRSRLLLAVCSIMVGGTAAWSVAVSWHEGSLLDRETVRPADGHDSAPPFAPRGSVVLASFVRGANDGPVVGTEMSVVDLETGAIRSLDLPQFASGDAQFKLEPIGGTLVYRGSSGAEVGTYAIDQDLRSRPVLLGESWYFVPSVAPGRVWLMILDPNSSDTSRGLKSVREVALDGEVKLEGSAPPPGDNIVGAVNQGLLIQQDGIDVWNPRSGRTVARLEGVFPVDTYEGTIAWCDFRCPQLHVTTLATGRDVVIRPPEGMKFEETYDGTFAPDGRSLAVPLRAAGELRVGIVDMATETVRLVPNSRLTPYELLEWSESGDWLLYETGQGFLGAFHPQTGESESVSLDPSKTYFAMAPI